MKLISDIRFFESNKENIDGYFPSDLGNIFRIDNQKYIVNINRLVLKLREQNFSLPDFDHIYINFSTCIEVGQISIANRTPDIYHPFYRFIDVGMSQEEFNNLSDSAKIERLIKTSVDVIISLFCSNNATVNLVKECANEILKNGEKSILIYKQKENGTYRVQVVVRLLEDGMYCPIIRIFDKNQQLLQEYLYNRLLTKDEFIFQFGSINIGKSSITIKPKSNSLSECYSFSNLKYSV